MHGLLPPMGVRGFSIVAVIMLAGLVSGLSLILAQMSKQQVQLQKANDSRVEVEALSRRVERILYNPAACLHTIGPGIILTNGGPNIEILEIKNHSGAKVFEKNGIYGNRLVKVVSLFLKDISITGSIAKLNFQVLLEKTSRAIQGNKQVVRDFPLSVELNGSNGALNCYSNLEAAILTATKNICTELGGTFAGGSCTHSTANLACPDPDKVPIGFDATGQVICSANSVATGGYTPGYHNCFFLAAYSGNHGHGGSAFLLKSTTPLTEVVNRARWKLHGNCQPPSTNGPYSCTVTSGGVTKTHTLQKCPANYVNFFLNPMSTINYGTASDGIFWWNPYSLYATLLLQPLRI